MDFLPAKDISDLKIIRDIAIRTWPNTFADILSSLQIEYMLELMYSIDSLKDQISNKSHHFIIVYDSEIPAGFAAYELNVNNKPVTKIHKLYFLPESQRKGYGKLTIDFIKQQAKQYHQKSLLLNVNKYNKAIQFYEHLGFIITREEIIDIGSGYIMDDFVMELAI